MLRPTPHEHHHTIRRLHRLTQKLNAETAKLHKLVPVKRRNRKDCEDPMASIDTAVAALTAAVADSIAAQDALLAAGVTSPAMVSAISDAATALATETTKIKAATLTP